MAPMHTIEDTKRKYRVSVRQCFGQLSVYSHMRGRLPLGSMHAMHRAVDRLRALAYVFRILAWGPNTVKAPEQALPGDRSSRTDLLPLTRCSA